MSLKVASVSARINHIPFPGFRMQSRVSLLDTGGQWNLKPDQHNPSRLSEEQHKFVSGAHRPLYQETQNLKQRLYLFTSATADICHPHPAPILCSTLSERAMFCVPSSLSQLLLLGFLGGQLCCSPWQVSSLLPMLLLILWTRITEVIILILSMSNVLVCLWRLLVLCLQEKSRLRQQYYRHWHAALREYCLRFCIASYKQGSYVSPCIDLPFLRHRGKTSNLLDWAEEGVANYTLGVQMS